MNNIKRILAIAALISGSAVHADIISGKVTDLATKGPLAGVRVGTAKAQVLSAADGSYTLNTDVATGLVAPAIRKGLPEITWDADAGAFRWDARHGKVMVEVRDVRGQLLDRSDSRSAAGATGFRFRDGAQGLLLVTVRSAAGDYTFRMNRIGSMAVLLKEEEAPGRSDIRALVKVSAITKVSFNMTGYDVYSQNVNGSKTGFDVALNKTGSLVWKPARMTWYESYPDPNSEECIKYSGCEYMGDFAAIGHKTKEWVAAHNLVAVHSKDYSKYKLKTLRLKYQDFLIDAQVVDMCADSDCGGCCTQNANTGGGFLIDLEINGVKRFGIDDGKIEWACIDCT